MRRNSFHYIFITHFSTLMKRYDFRRLKTQELCYFKRYFRETMKNKNRMWLNE